MEGGDLELGSGLLLGNSAAREPAADEEVGETDCDGADDAEDCDDAWLLGGPVAAVDGRVADGEVLRWNGCHCDSL